MGLVIFPTTKQNTRCSSRCVAARLSSTFVRRMEPGADELGSRPCSKLQRVAILPCGCLRRGHHTVFAASRMRRLVAALSMPMWR